MPTYKSVKGEWFPQDELTKTELEAHGIDHLGIHISEDPYVKNLEYVTGVSRKELDEQKQQVLLQTMQQQMLITQQAMALALAGDKEGCAKLIAQMKAPEQTKEEKIDKEKMQEEEFEKSMGGSKAKEKVDLSNLPKVKEEKAKVHESQDDPSAIQAGVASGFKKRGK